MENNGVRGEIWRQNHDKFHIPWKTILLVTQCTIVLIRKNIGSIKFISGEVAEPDMNFIDPIFSVLGQLFLYMEHVIPLSIRYDFNSGTNILSKSPTNVRLNFAIWLVDIVLINFSAIVY
jgi:hypothetical protein